MESEQRRNQRKPLERHAWVVREDGSFVGQCALGNISETGAKLVFSVAPDLPDEFVLRLSLDGRVARKCRVAWKTANEVGVAFTARLVGASPLSVHAL